MRTMKSWMTITGALALALFSAGCFGPSARVGQESQAIALSSLPPNLPGCQSVTVSHRVTVRKIDGVHDLFVAYDGDQPLCIDSGEFISVHFTAGVGTDPLASNPMPGEPVPPGGSNPMPGNPEPSSVGTVASNPMPGTDPGSSNPMPGHPDYSGQQGYTSGH